MSRPKWSEILGVLAGRQGDRVIPDPGRIEAACGRQVMRRDGLVSHDDRLLPPHQRAISPPALVMEAGADEDVVAALGEADGEALGLTHWAAAPGSGRRPRRAGSSASAAMVRVTVASGGPSPLSMVKSASA